MKIKSLSHITFICKDLEKTACMLRKVFDAEEICSSHSPSKFFNIAGMWIEILEGDSSARTYNHIAFQIDEKDLPEFRSKIQALNLEILPGRKREIEEEGESLYFYDFDNHLFELHTRCKQECLQHESVPLRLVK